MKIFITTIIVLLLIVTGLYFLGYVTTTPPYFNLAPGQEEIGIDFEDNTFTSEDFVQEVYIEPETIITEDNVEIIISGTPATEEQSPADLDPNNQNQNPEDPNALSSDPITFRGILTEVDTGCFADGECFAVVDGNRVTAIMGWSQETVGSTIIEGNADAGFGDLYLYLDQEVEVFAQPTGDASYTLYGSEGFYIKTL